MSKSRRVAKLVLRVLLAIAMLLSGVLHFVNPEPYTMMVPDYLPAPEALVYISGVAELALGVALFVPKARQLAGWGVIALLLAVWPANIYQATSGVQPPGLEMSATGAWFRVVFQVVLIYWAWAVTRPDPETDPETGPDAATTAT